MANTSIPVVLLGRTSEVGRVVTDALKPEYEVIHFLSTADSAGTQIPLLLTGNRPTQASAYDIGTQDYNRKAQAVIVGSYFTNSMVDAVRKQCGDTLNVPWMIAGVTEEQRDERLKQPMDPAKYGPFAANVLKGAMAQVKDEGNWEHDGVFVYK